MPVNKDTKNPIVEAAAEFLSRDTSTRQLSLLENRLENMGVEDFKQAINESKLWKALTKHIRATRAWDRYDPEEHGHSKEEAKVHNRKLEDAYHDTADEVTAAAKKAKVSPKRAHAVAQKIRNRDTGMDEYEHEFD